MADDIELMPVKPFYRLNWPDGTNFDYSNDEAELRAEIAKLDPEDVAGYDRFLAYSAYVYEEGYKKLGTVAFLDFKSMITASPALAKAQAWRSVYSMVSSFVKNEKLREVLSFHTLLVGGNLCVDPQARKGRRRLVCARRHEQVDRRDGHAFRAAGRNCAAR
jgi:phytoene desaturase